MGKSSNVQYDNGKFPSIIVLEGRLKHIYEIEKFIATKIMKSMSFK